MGRMPARHSRNRRRQSADFHVYNRERNREPIFFDDEDRRYFLWLLRRYLSIVPHTDSRGRPYRSHRGRVQLLAYSLMLNHFHLVIRQLRSGGMEALMHAVMTSYVRYFNKRHAGSGALFDGRYRAAIKPDRRAKLNAIAYVHDNHSLRCECEFCSHRLYVGTSESPSWIDARVGLSIFGGESEYLDYRQMRAGLSAIAD